MALSQVVTFLQLKSEMAFQSGAANDLDLLKIATSVTTEHKGYQLHCHWRTGN